MNKHKEIIKKLTLIYESDDNNISLLVTGSVAREEAAEKSDLDLLLIAKTKQPFKEDLIDDILVETKTNTLEGFIQKMKDKPMSVYQWLDAKIIFDKGDTAEKVINEASNLYENYTPDSKELAGVKKWLESAKIKIESAQNNIVFGDIEENENLEESAKRETGEEFGIKSFEETKDLNYKIEFDGKHGLTEAHFVALKVKGLDIQITLNEESIGYDWMLIEKVKEVMKHDDEVKAFDLIISK